MSSVGRAEHPAHHRQRQGHGQVGDEVAAATVDERVDEAVDQRPGVAAPCASMHRRLERPGDRQALGGVRRRVAGHEDAGADLAVGEARAELRRPQSRRRAGPRPRRPPATGCSAGRERRCGAPGSARAARRTWPADRRWKAVDSRLNRLRPASDMVTCSSSGNSDGEHLGARRSTAARVAGSDEQGVELAQAEQQDEERLHRDLALRRVPASAPAPARRPGRACQSARSVGDLRIALRRRGAARHEEPAGLGERRGEERVRRRPARRGAAPSPGSQAVQRPPAGVDEQLGLVAEVVVDGRRGHAGAGRDVGHRRAAVAVLDARSHGRRQQPLTGGHAGVVDLRRPAAARRSATWAMSRPG